MSKYLLKHQCYHNKVAREICMTQYSSAFRPMSNTYQMSCYPDQPNPTHLYLCWLCLQDSGSNGNFYIPWSYSFPAAFYSYGCLFSQIICTLWVWNIYISFFLIAHSLLFLFANPQFWISSHQTLLFLVAVINTLPAHSLYSLRFFSIPSLSW